MRFPQKYDLKWAYTQLNLTIFENIQWKWTDWADCCASIGKEDYWNGLRGHSVVSLPRIDQAKSGRQKLCLQQKTWKF